MSDPYFANVSLLLHFDGADGQTTTVDSSPYAYAVLRMGSSVALSTAQSKFGGSSTTSIAATSNCWYVLESDETPFHFGAGEFTVESWVRFSSAPSGVLKIVGHWLGVGAQQSWFFGHVSGALAFYYTTDGSTLLNVGAAWSPALGTWYHVAVDRDASNVLRVYVDGVVLVSTTVSATLHATESQNVEVAGGSLYGGITGFVDEVRVTKGVARYAGAFTPPTAAFPDASTPLVATDPSLPSITAPMAVWPFLADGHSIDEDSYYAQVAYTTGHSRTRRRWTQTGRIVTVRWLLEEEDLTEVTNWYEDTLLAGTREWSARVRKQGAGPDTGLWWRARWIDYSTEMLNFGRGTISGKLWLTGEGSALPPETGALAMEVSVALLDIRSSVAVQAHLAMEVLVDLRQPLELAMEVEVALLSLVSHAASGVLAAGNSTVAGSSVEGLHTTAGALSAAASVVAGVSLHPHTSAGVLAAGSGALSAASARVTGALISSGFEFTDGTTSFADGGTLGATWTVGAQGSIVSTQFYEDAHSLRQTGGICATTPWPSGLDFGSSDWTIGVAARVNDGANGFGTYLLSAAGTGAGGDAWSLHFGGGYPGNLQFVAYLDSGTVTLTYGGGVTGNVWTDITITRVGSALTLSLNGSSVASTTISGAFAARGGGHLVIGASNTGGSNATTAYFDKLRITAP